VSGVGAAATDELAGVRWLSQPGRTSRSPAFMSQSASTCGGFVSAKSWIAVVLAVVALCVAVGFAVAASLDFVFLGLAVVVAVSATYFAGRLDKRRGDG
jgi:hypothetical protein